MNTKFQWLNEIFLKNLVKYYKDSPYQKGKPPFAKENATYHQNLTVFIYVQMLKYH